jgi:hypothetical protein
LRDVEAPFQVRCEALNLALVENDLAVPPGHVMDFKSASRQRRPAWYRIFTASLGSQHDYAARVDLGRIPPIGSAVHRLDIANS